MDDSRGPEERALHRVVGEVLHYVWDPIGVAGVVHARDEYDGYVAGVCAILWQQPDATVVSEHLERIATEQMELSGTKARSDLAAAKLLEWRVAITREPV
jgi:hypothetical protein